MKEAPALSPQEQAHQRDILLGVLRWGLLIAPPSTIAYALVYLRHPLWPALLQTVVIFLVVLVSAWALWRPRPDVLRRSVRVLLVLSAVCLTTALLFTPPAVWVLGTLGFANYVLLALAVERRGAMVWGGMAIVLTVIGLYLPDVVPLPRMEVGEGITAYFRILPIPMFFVVAILCRPTLRYLREALASSEADRVELELSNAQRARRRVELQATEADLSRLAARLEKMHGELQRMVRVVSQDLRAPLAALMGHCRSLEGERRARLNEVGREHVQGLTESARYMDELIVGLLSYSTVDSPGPMELVDVQELLEQLARRMQLRDRAHLTLPAPPLSILAHRPRLAQIFISLLDNAVKFQRPGARPEISVEWVDRGDAWEFAVRDNGIGIEPRFAERIFGLFQRLHLKTEYEGTGVGLAVVRKAVETGGGKAWVEPSPGGGSVFRFTLPRS